MDITLPLDRMSVEEKLRAIEAIWEDLCRNPGSVPAPEWHRDVLAAREERLRAGDERVVDWEEAKRQIRDASR